jgi:hypothetical protein
MKIEVFRESSDNPVMTYNEARLSMADFHGWKDPSCVEMPLVELRTAVERLKPADQEFQTTNLPVDPYLPLSDRIRLLEQVEDEQSFQPPILLVDVIRGIAGEILRHHRPNDEYSVRISE